ncbi:uncharacterized protein LOC123534863 [Mercenaria mercenaria]|uniref:uncharacterized protein LOC123534863 n=1 Tax=Mercenaria mercenaria TaxID=6596 RepID=UPI00234F97E5|nr:uncharacterized protein LOC123534863 [Mercenaria mercenaria]
MMIIGNKCDLVFGRPLMALRSEKLAQKHGAYFFEVSAKTNANVQEAFYTLCRDAVLRKYGKKKDKTARIFQRLLQPFFGTKAHTATSVPEEFQQDPYALGMFERALRDGKEKDRSIRINVVGNYRQGKTSLIRRLIGKKVIDVSSTDGIDVINYKCHHTADGKFSLKKAEKGKAKSDIVERLVSVALANEHQNDVPSITNTDIYQGESEFRTLTTTSETTKAHISQKAGKRKEEQITTDLYRHQQEKMDSSNMDKSPSGDGKQLSRFENTNRIPVLSVKEKETFAKELTKRKSKTSNIETETLFDIWDFGGQQIFYATHTLFHSKNAIYLLVFDLSLDLKSVIVDGDFQEESDDRDMEYFLRFWMNSIHSFVGSEDGSVPTVILVGTHKDKVKGNLKIKGKSIEKYFNEIRALFDGTKLLNHIHSENFAVDNLIANDEAVLALRETIISLGDAESKTIEIPAKWIQLEKSLRTRAHFKLIPFETVLAIDEENYVPIGDPEQIKLFLRYHHSKGMLIYFDEEPLSEHIVLDPQYLIDAFKCIITAERFCTNDPDIRPLWKILHTEGRLKKALIDKQWRKDADKMFIKHKEILISFLTKHHIISEATRFDDSTQQSLRLGWFVVPSLLKARLPQEMQLFLIDKKQTSVRFVLVFENSTIVSTVYHRLMAALIGKWPIAQFGTKVLISKDKCVVRLNTDHAGLAEMGFDTIELTGVSLRPSAIVCPKQADIFRRFSEAVVIHEFSKLERKNSGQTKPYKTKYRCNDERHNGSGSIKTIDVDKPHDKTKIPCPDLFSHEIDLRKARSEWFQDRSENIVVLNAELNDKILSKISRSIGNNWQTLGLELGVAEVQIEQITENHPNNTAMRIYHMLKSWCLQSTDSVNMNVLVRKMQECSNVSIQWDAVRNICDEIDSKYLSYKF